MLRNLGILDSILGILQGKISRRGLAGCHLGPQLAKHKSLPTGVFMQLNVRQKRLDWASYATTL